MKQILILIASVLSLNLNAQITAQGQGGNLVIWNAVGLEQQFGKRWTNKNTVAFSRHSGDEDWNPLEQFGIFTVREEVSYRISKHFKASLGTFYAFRDYEDDRHPDYTNEIRFYPRIYHEFNIHKIKFSHYLRCDLRLFAGPNFSKYSTPFEFRNRYLVKATVPISKDNRHSVSILTEFFFATDEKIKDGRTEFTSYNFTENRTSIFYRYKLPNNHVVFDWGLMAQTWKDSRTGDFRETLILQMDIILSDIF